MIEAWSSLKLRHEPRVEQLDGLRRLRRARSMSWVTSTTPRLVTKKRSVIDRRVLADLRAVGNHAVLIENAAQ